MISTLRALMRRAGDFLFGFDFFISYAHDDGLHYPQNLANMLQAQHFRVFLDSRVYVAGDDLSSATRRRIKMSKYLILLARPEALISNWVLIELQRCRAEIWRPKVININSTLENARDDNALKQLLEDKIYITETLDHVDAEPTERAIDSIIRSFKSTRQDVIRLRAIIAVCAAIIAITAFAGWQYMESRKQIFHAREQTALRYAANAERQMFQNPQESLILAAQGAAASQSENSIQASTDAINAALAVIRQRQEIHQNHNWGSNLFQSYIASAWFEADLHARYSKGGGLLLLTTERGASSNRPPGDAFLLDTKSLSMKMLDIGPAWGTRDQSETIIATLKVKPGIKSGVIEFVCPSHQQVTGRLEIGTGDADIKILAREKGFAHWYQVGKQRTFGTYAIKAGGQVEIGIEGGRHGLAFLDKDQALAMLDFGDSLSKFDIKMDIKTRRDLKRRLEFVGFGNSGNKIYLARQYNVEVYSIDGAFQREFPTGGGCTKYPISYVTGVMDDQLILYGDTDGGVYILDFNTGDCDSLGISSDKILIKSDLNLSGQFAILVFRDKTASLWRVSENNTGENFTKLLNEEIISAWFHPRIDNQLLTAGEDGLVALWEVRDGDLQQIRTYQRTGEPIEFSMFSDDGKSIVAVTKSKEVLIWDSATSEAIGSIQSQSWERGAAKD